MKDLWDYSRVTEPTAYCDDTSYRLAVEFLDLPDCVLEDWGCGTGYARKFVKHANYRGIDGSNSQFCQLHKDLRHYLSQSNLKESVCILIRHVLEHNHEWSDILLNALESFEKRLCIVLYTPLTSYRTFVMSLTPKTDLHTSGIPNLSLGRDELWEMLRGFWVREQVVMSATPHGQETILYVTRENHPSVIRRAYTSPGFLLPEDD